MGLRALYSAISGLQSDSTWLDVTGNNISNADTVGYKASRLEFAVQLSQILSSGSGDSGSNIGGTDAEAVGLGTRVDSIETNFSQGATQTTGVTTDISIQGNGFLVAKNGDETYLTRAGNLSFDSEGYLVDANGDRVQGYNSILEYDHKVINTADNGGFAQITSAVLTLDNTDTSDIQGIRIDSQTVLPAKATTVINFKGNLDSDQQAEVLNLYPGGEPSLPVGLAIETIGTANAIDTTRMTTQAANSGGIELKQVNNLSTYTQGLNAPPDPLENGFVNLDYVKSFAGSYVWDKQPPTAPADQVEETVYDSLGNAHQITIQFYQVNDLGDDGVNSADGPSQVCYAWYAFDTTGGQAVSTANLLGGTGIGEGNLSSAGSNIDFYNRGNDGNAYAGDFLWFNTDGSLASSGGFGGVAGPPGLNSNYMSTPVIYLPENNTNPATSPLPSDGAEITAISLNFGTYGLLGQGKTDGITSFANGSYQTVNGVNTYVPDSDVYADSQDGYQSGNLESVSFNQTGIIEGTFSDGQTAALAQIALAQVPNEEGLSRVGGNNFAVTSSSGALQLGMAGQSSFGTILPDSLEASNVNLADELSDMILAQRGFDSNSRMISVANETLEKLATLGEGS